MIAYTTIKPVSTIVKLLLSFQLLKAAGLYKYVLPFSGHQTPKGYKQFC